ncbi:hypothetical protein [Falsiroseomonas oryzae]|uniref:hypothetical protein n=1 Tax=Falsiroseomonas oryzae TaxID=2766473 RepID=UPI0022EABC78|nr:hypothetical protein [Roseomonas sp. MO-31]
MTIRSPACIALAGDRIADRGNGRIATALASRAAPGIPRPPVPGRAMPFDVTLPDLFKWLATAGTLLGAGMTAADLGRRFTGWGFAALAAGSASWLAAAQLEQETQLGLTNLVLLALNLFGVWRWLARGAPAPGAARRAETAAE